MKVIVIRQSAFGDILHVLPALFALKRARPDIGLHLLVRKRFRGLAARAPFLDAVVTAPAAADAVVDCQGLLRTAWLALRCRARLRAGYAWADVREKPAALFYNRRVKVRAVHVVDRHAELLAGALGVQLAVDRDYRADFLRTGDPEVAAFLSRVPEPRLLVHPTSAQAGKHLAAQEWRPVLDLLLEAGYHPVLSRGPGEEAALAPWKAALPGAIEAPVFPLESLPDLAAGASLMLGADTGLTHLADQLGVPVLSWYTLWPPERNGPYFSPSLVFHRRKPDAGEVSRWLASLKAPSGR